MLINKFNYYKLEIFFNIDKTDILIYSLSVEFILFWE